jgi:hypothetical protein
MNRFHGYDSTAYVAWRAGTTNRVVAPALQAGSIPGPLIKVYKFGLCPTTVLSYEPTWNLDLWGLGTGEEEGYRTGPPGYIGWRNSFLGIDSGAPYTFKNTGSGPLRLAESIPGLL